MSVYRPPENYSLDPKSGLYYREARLSAPNGQPLRHVIWFNADTGEYTQQSYPLTNSVGGAAPAQRQSAAVKTKHSKKPLLIVIALLLVVSIVGGSAAVLWQPVIAPLIFGRSDTGAIPTDLLGQNQQGNTTQNAFYGGLVSYQNGWIFFSDVEAGGVLCATPQGGNAADTLVLTDFPVANINVVGDTIAFTGVEGSYYVRAAEDGATQLLQLPEDARNVTGYLELMTDKDRIVWGGSLYMATGLQEYLKSGGKKPLSIARQNTPDGGYCYGINLKNNKIEIQEAKLQTQDIAQTSPVAAVSGNPSVTNLSANDLHYAPNYSINPKTLASSFASDSETIPSEEGSYYDKLASFVTALPVSLSSPSQAERDANLRADRSAVLDSWRKYTKSVPEGYEYTGICYSSQTTGKYSYSLYLPKDGTDVRKGMIIELDHTTNKERIIPNSGRMEVHDDKMYAMDFTTGALVEYDGSNNGKTISNLPVENYVFGDNGDIMITYKGSESETRTALISKHDYTDEYLAEGLKMGSGVSANSDHTWYTHPTPPDSIQPAAEGGGAFLTFPDVVKTKGGNTYYTLAYTGDNYEIGVPHWVKVTVSTDKDGRRTYTREAVPSMRVPPDYLNSESFKKYKDNYQYLLEELRRKEKENYIPPGYSLKPIGGDWFNGAELVPDAETSSSKPAADSSTEAVRDSRVSPEAAAEMILSYVKSSSTDGAAFSAYDASAKQQFLSFYGETTQTDYIKKLSEMFTSELGGISQEQAKELSACIMEWVNAVEYTLQTTNTTENSATVTATVTRCISFDSIQEKVTGSSMQELFLDYMKRKGLKMSDLQGYSQEEINALAADIALEIFKADPPLSEESYTYDIKLTQHPQLGWTVDDVEGMLNAVMINER